MSVGGGVTAPKGTFENLKMDLLWQGDYGTNGGSITVPNISTYDLVYFVGAAWGNSSWELLVPTSKLNPGFTTDNITNGYYRGGVFPYRGSGTSYFVDIAINNANNSVQFYTGYDQTFSSNQAKLYKIYGINLGFTSE